MEIKPFDAVEKKWATMHARPFEHNDADHEPRRRNTQGGKEDKEYDPRKNKRVWKQERKPRMSSSREVPPRLLSPAKHLIVEASNGATVEIMHGTTRHWRAEKVENLGVEVRSSVVGQVDDVGKYLFGSTGRTEERGLIVIHQSGESIVDVSCEIIIKG
jgi:hypothetical protein